MADIQLPADLAAFFTSDTRLYRLEGGGCDALMVERWDSQEALSTPGQIQVTAISMESALELDGFIGRPVSLVAILADGSKCTRSGVVRDAERLASDGGLARYRLTLVPWLWYTTLGRHNRVFQDKSVIEIVEQVWADYSEIAAWSLADDIGPFFSDVQPRSYCVQYRESDYDFVVRLLAEEGIGYTLVEDDEAPMRHSVHLFADSSDLPEDATSAAAGGIRFHRASSQESQDAIQRFGGDRELAHAVLTSTSYDYKTKSNVSGQMPTAHTYGADGVPALELYDYPGAYTHATAAEAERYGRLAMQATEARYKNWLGYSTVRTLRPGTNFSLTESNLDFVGAATGRDDERNRQFMVVDVAGYGINNLPSELARRVEKTLGQGQAVHGSGVDGDLLTQAQKTGYGNRFTAIRRDVPWRPVLDDDTGRRFNPRPTAFGPQTATVVGPNGETAANGSDELYTDALGRIKIRFHWQTGSEPDDRLTCWIRCAQRYAGAGQGSQFIPRIGHEVLVQFLGGDIDRPVVTGSSYNGQGEAGTPATPGGTQQQADTQVYGDAVDHRPSAQANLAGGNAPAWHGAGAGSDAHRNAAALSGFKSAEFGGAGHNQLAFDDTDDQQRIQLATTQASSQLNLGHLIHQADNYRGSFRGTGFELRTDAYGAIRGERGVLLSSYPLADGAPAGEFTAGNALLKQSTRLGTSYSQVATTHNTSALAAHLGATTANQSVIDDQRSPLAALLKTAQGQVTGAEWAKAQADAADKNTAADARYVPHSADPILAVAAKAGIGLIAGADLQHHAGETLTVASGQDHNLAVNEQHRIHAGQAIGVLSGVQGSGDGLKAIAGQGDLDLQAQNDAMKVQSKDDLKVISANAAVEFAAKQAIHLATKNGASITIEGGKITVASPGKLTIHAGNKVFEGGAHLETRPASFPKSDFCLSCFLKAAMSGGPLVPA